MRIYIILGTLLIATGIFFAGDRHGRAAMQLEVAKANQKYQTLKSKQQEKIDALTQQNTDRISDITKQRDAAIARLRHRPNRMPKASQAKCKGTTGAELSGPDAEFLTREAARADKLRQALMTCYSYADELQRK